MQRTSRCQNPSSIARYHWINPVVIDVAVEDFNPRSRRRESNRVVVPSCLGKSCNYNYVFPCALQPSVKCNDAVLVVDVKCVDIVTSQTG